jgi:hypothetical protein
MASRAKRLYIGAFTKRYNIPKLVYEEDYGSILEAIEREKQLKGWLRQEDRAHRGAQSGVGRPGRDMVHRAMRSVAMLRMTK